MSNYAVLNRMFTQRNLKDLIYRSTSRIYEEVVNEHIDNSNNRTNLDLINDIYDLLFRCYRNEYFYENTLINKLLFGIYSPNTTTALSQIPISESKADFILINGRATVFEIKTELDSFYRLETQLKDYYKAFKFVIVITSENQFSKLYQLLYNTPVGINVITERGTISRKLRKEPEETSRDLDYRTIFNMLHKNEFENIIYKYFNRLPNTAPAYYYDECFEMFEDIPMEYIQDSMLVEMKKRQSISIERFKEIPYPLKAVAYFLDLSDKEHDRLQGFLLEEYNRG